MEDLCLATGKVMVMVLEENRRQIKKWGIQDREPFEWLGFATEELGELAEAIGEWQFRDGPIEDVAKEAIQTATLCLKIAEMFNYKLLPKISKVNNE